MLGMLCVIVVTIASLDASLTRPTEVSTKNYFDYIETKVESNKCLIQMPSGAYTKELGKRFKLPEFGPCITLRCTRQGVVLDEKKSSCEYGDGMCSNSLQDSGREFVCIKTTIVGKKVKNGENSYTRQNRLVASFSADKPRGISSYVLMYPRKKMCDIEGHVVKFKKPVSIHGFPCVSFKCKYHGLFFTKPTGFYDGSSCVETHKKACTVFEGVQLVYGRKRENVDGTRTTVWRGFLPTGPDTCLPPGRDTCVQVGETWEENGRTCECRPGFTSVCAVKRTTTTATTTLPPPFRRTTFVPRPKRPGCYDMFSGETRAIGETWQPHNYIYCECVKHPSQTEWEGLVDCIAV